MKTILLMVVLSIVSTLTHAAQIKSARLDAGKKNILIDVAYGGGCGKHDFSLDLKGCAESFPVQCEADLVHKSNDFCEAFIHTTVVINLAQYGLNKPYYKGGWLTIKGDHDWQTKKPSSATVTLPQ